MAEKLTVEQIPVHKVLIDENQPRKLFDAAKMFTLKESIRKHGIRMPLAVEDMGNGKYLLEDGERRFRCALELDLAEVPCTIVALRTEGDRLIQQFSIQEQHEAWTPIEKAMAILNLSKILGISMLETCARLDVDSKNRSRYVAFAELGDKESYVKNEIPLDYAPIYRQLVNRAKTISQEKLNREFDRADVKTFEHQISKQIVKGIITKRNDLTKLYDSFKANPKSIETFMTKDNVTPTGLFISSKAQGAFALRNLVTSSYAMSNHGKAFMQARDVELTDADIKVLKQAIKVAKEVIGLAE